MATSASSMPLSSSSSGALDVTETASKQYRAMKKFVAFPFEYHQELELKIVMRVLHKLLTSSAFRASMQGLSPSVPGV
eukprot:4197279-Pleurochrysis_carterae.AAC.2